MSTDFTPLNVKEVRRETPDCVSILLDVQNGQTEKFSFKPGQYLTFKKEFNGEELRRSYSICSSPAEGELRVAVKEVTDGRFSGFANKELKEGDVLEVMSPAGNFVNSAGENGSHYVFIAAGSGITPVRSIILDILESEPDSSVTLFYGNRGFHSIVFREDFEGLKNKYMNRLELFHILSREDPGIELFHGRIDADRVRKLGATLFNPEAIRTFFICGPESMILGASEALQELGVPKDRIKFELFTTDAGSAVSTVAEEDRGLESSIKVRIDGDTWEFPMTRGENILEACHTHGVDAPFACKGGVCCTCRAKLVEGEVTMDVNYALEDEEVEAGFILTCQAHPVTDNVVVDFDQQ